MCFHMQQDGAAEDGPEKEWNLLQQRWLLGKLEHLTGNTFRLVIPTITVCWHRKLKFPFLYLNVPFILPVQWELKIVILCTVAPLLPPPRQNLMLSCKYGCIGEALELLTLFLLELRRFDNCDVYFQLSNF